MEKDKPVENPDFLLGDRMNEQSRNLAYSAVVLAEVSGFAGVDRSMAYALVIVQGAFVLLGKACGISFERLISSTKERWDGATLVTPTTGWTPQKIGDA